MGVKTMAEEEERREEKEGDVGKMMLFGERIRVLFSQVLSPRTQSGVKKPWEEAKDLPVTTKVVSKGRVKQPNGKVAKEEKIAGGNGSEEVDNKLRPKSRLSNLPKQWCGEQMTAGWPSWLSEACGETLGGWIPRQANTFWKIDKIGQGTYSNVYKAKDMLTGKIVALKKVRFDNLESESVRFMAREILILRHPMTSRVVTPELLLGLTDYGVSIDLKCAGCILAELFSGRPILPGRTEVKQLHKIYVLCVSPDDEYWKKFKLQKTTLYKPKEPRQRWVRSKLKDFPSSALPLIDTLLVIHPEERGSATATLQSEFFTTEPYACEPSSLPRYPPSKEIDARRRDDEAPRLRATCQAQGDNKKKSITHDRAVRAFPAPEANAEVQSNIDRRRHQVQHESEMYE